MNCSRCCEDRITKSEIDRWSNNLNQMLDSEMGRKKFNQFLLDRGFDESLLTVRFWEKCDILQKQLEKENHSRLATPRNEVLKGLRDIVDYADENVNFYDTQMESLQQVLHEKNSVKICDILKKAKQSANSLLEDDHKLFSEIILKEYCSSLCK